MHYEVRVVEDHQLPPQTAWAFVRSGDHQIMFIKRAVMALGPVVLADVLTSAWRTWMAVGASTAVHGLPVAG